MEDGTIPIIGAVSFEVDKGEALEGLIQGLQIQAAFSYCFLSVEMNNKPYVGTVIHTLKKLDDLSKKLSKAYLLKAANIYHEHLNDFHVQKSQKEYEQESELAGCMVDFVAELNPNIRLCKENRMTYAYPYDSNNTVITMIINSFPRNTVEFVNDSIVSMTELNKTFKNLGKREKELFKKYFKCNDD